MRKRGLAFFILLAVAAVGLVWSFREVFPRSVQEVEGVRIKRGTLELTLPVTGIFETRTVELAFDAPGRLTTVAVREGDAVSAGTLIAAVDEDEARAAAGPAGGALRAVGGGGRGAAPQPGELQQADGAVEVARAALEEARRALERTQQLFRDGAVSQAQLDAARTQAESAGARYRQAVAQRDLLRAGARPEAIAVAAQQALQAEAAWQGGGAHAPGGR